MKIVFVLLIVLEAGPLVSFAAANGQAADSFICEEKRTVALNNSYLDELADQIIPDAKSSQVRKDVNLMLRLIKKVLCYHQIDPELSIYEHIIGFAGIDVFKQARAKLSGEEQERLDESLKTLASPEEL